METILRDNVPVYLRNGALFQNLDSSDEESFEVPSDCYKKDPNVTNAIELSFVLRSTRFWGLESPPYTVVSYLVRREGEDIEETLAAVMDDFPEYSPFLLSLFFARQKAAEEVISTAVEIGLGEGVVKHLHEHDGFPLTLKSYIGATVLDNLVLLHQVKHGCTWTKEALRPMLMHGSLQCLKHALETEQLDTKGIITIAVAHRQVKVVQYLLDTGIVPEPLAMAAALMEGYREIVQLLHQAGCAWPENAAFLCVSKNQLDCLIYAHENGCPLTPDLCNIAASRGHLRCLEYLHLHGAPWDETTLVTAVMNGRLECLQYAHQHGCPVEPAVMTVAINYGAFRCALYLLRHGVIGKHVAMFAFHTLCFVFQLYMLNSVLLCGFVSLSVLQSLVELFVLRIPDDITSGLILTVSGLKDSTKLVPDVQPLFLSELRRFDGVGGINKVTYVVHSLHLCLHV